MKHKKLKSIMWSRAVLLVVALLLGAFSTADAQTWTSGECTVTLSDGILTVSKAKGNGRMSDYTEPVIYYEGYQGPDQEVVEPEWRYKSVDSIVVNEGVTYIGNFAFKYLDGVQSVSLPEGLVSIGESVFSGLYSFHEITIPSTVTNIGPDAFYECYLLERVTCYADPAKLTWIDNDCNDFTQYGEKWTLCLVKKEYLAAYQEKFDGVNVTFVTDFDIQRDWQSGGCWVKLDDDSGTLTVTKLEDGEGRMDDYWAYNRAPWHKHAAKVTSLIVGEGVTVIGNKAFEDFVNLKTVTLPEGVTTIKSEAFGGCTGLLTITLPSTVTYISATAFWNCGSVDDLYLNSLPTELEWDMNPFALKSDKGTRCHVKVGYQKTFEMLFPYQNVTFVGDLPNDDPGLAIDATNFPDANFRQLVHDLPENNGDNYLNLDEIITIETLLANGCGIKDLKGVEHFRELKTLHCSRNQLTTLNLSGNPKLQMLDCDHNQLTTLDVSQNPQLTSILCAFNQIKDPGMDALASSLPASYGHIYLLAEEDPNGNVLTLAQLRVMRNKGWTVYYKKASGVDNWVVYEGGQYTIMVAGTKVTDMNKDDVLGDGSVKYEEVDCVGILTFTNNHFTAPNNTYIIEARGADLVINAPEGGLTLESQFGIDMRGNKLTVNGDITFKMEFKPVYNCADFIVNGNLTATNINVQGGTFIVNGNTKITADSYSYCIGATSVVLNGAKHELSGAGCISATNVTIAGDLTATASGSYAIWTSGDLTMVSGTWKINAENEAVRCGGNFTIPDTYGIKSPAFGRIGTSGDHQTVRDFSVNEYSPSRAKEVEIVDYPCLYLYDYEDCSSQLNTADGLKGVAALRRSIYKKGWNTFAAPFAITDLEGTFGQGVKVKRLTGSTLTGGTLKLTFADADRIEPGKPYLVRVNETVNLKSHVFEDVTISKDIVPTVTDVVDLVPALGRSTVEGDNPKSVMFFLGEYGLVFAQELPDVINGFRAYFRLKDPDAVRSISMNLDDDGDATSLREIRNEELEMRNADWYTVDGRKLSGRPTAKGVYINNGKKTIIK